MAGWRGQADAGQSLTYQLDRVELRGGLTWRIFLERHGTHGLRSSCTLLAGN